MKAKLTIYLYVALFPSIIYGHKRISECSKDVAKIAKEGGLIAGVFQPQGDGPVGITYTSFVFRGVLHPNSNQSRKVAMKFIQNSQKELEMYRYLDAINNEDVQKYGIPTVYYYGMWKENLTMIGMTLLDKTVRELMENKELFKRYGNFLIIIRYFTVTTKYMHSRGVRHNYITLSNMMVHDHMCYIIDFSLASKIHQKTAGGPLDFASRRAFSGGERWPKEDWESFLYSICYALGVRFDWIGLDPSEVHLIPKLKANITLIKNKIEKISTVVLRNILLEFADEVYYDGGRPPTGWSITGLLKHWSPEFPDYDHFFKLADDQVARIKSKGPVMFSWLTDPERKAILQYATLPNILHIPQPKSVDFPKFYSQFRDPLDMSAFSSSSCSASSSAPISSDKSKEKGKEKMFESSAHNLPKEKGD